MSQSNKEYEKLKTIWYKRLKKSGFTDIERNEKDFNGGGSSRFARSRYIAELPARTEYYNLANRFLLEHEFTSELERIIWEYHANGIGSRNMAKLLRQTKVSRLGYNGISNKVKALKAIMLAKYVKTK